jgi:hypothetical protein
MEEIKEKINLESKSWYRVLKILGIGIIIFSFFVPTIQISNLESNNDYSEIAWLIDGLVNVFLWSFIIFILKKALIYIVYGKNISQSKEESIFKRKLTIDKILVRRLMKIFFVVSIVFMIISLILLYLPI